MSQKKLNNEELETRLQFYKLKAEHLEKQVEKLKDKHIRNLLKIIEKMNVLQYNEELDICDFVYYLTDYIYEIREGEE